jgi:hypothetical protein
MIGLVALSLSAWAEERTFNLDASGPAATADLVDQYTDWDQRFQQYARSLEAALRREARSGDAIARADERLGILQGQADILLDLAREHHALALRIRAAIRQLGAVQQRYGGQAERWKPTLSGCRRLLQVSTRRVPSDMESVLVVLVLDRLAAGMASGERLAHDAARVEAVLEKQRARMDQQRRVLLAEIGRVRAELPRAG